MGKPIRYVVIHETKYSYESPVSLSQQQLHLTPRLCSWQDNHRHKIEIDPQPAFLQERRDSFGNPICQFAIETPHDHLRVYAESIIDVYSHPPERPFAETPSWESVRDMLEFGAKPVHIDAVAYRFESTYVRVKGDFRAYAAPSFPPGRPLLEAVESLMQRIFKEFTFDPKATTVSTPVLEILKNKRGVCQDFSHLMLSCLRSMGLAARYVSGYLLTKPPAGKPRMIGADASHAWLSVYCPAEDGGFWVDFDPTNNLVPDTEHITLAWGRDFGDISPLRGVILGGDNQDPEVAVTVMPLAEARALLPHLSAS